MNWYAVEYAYGATVINNGNRADKVYKFSNRRDRDDWVAQGNPNIASSGYRECVTSKHALVRNADMFYTPDNDN